MEARDAVLVNASEHTEQELTQTISKALNNRRIRIAPDSFTKSSRAIIELSQVMGPDGRPIMGRDYSKPDHFYLKMSGEDCWLWHQQTGLYYKLELSQCTAAL